MNWTNIILNKLTLNPRSPLHKIVEGFASIKDRSYKIPNFDEIKDLPLVFVVGCQRSGTTLFYKSFMKHPEVFYITQASQFFPKAPISFTRLVQRLGADKNEDFLEKYNADKDLWIRQWKRNGFYYCEGSRVWNKFNGAQQNLAKTQSFFNNFLGKQVFLNPNKKVFVCKNPGNSLRIAEIKAVFPNAKFIHIVRDGRAVVNSIINIHRKLNVERWGAKPLELEGQDDLSEYAVWGHQWSAIVQTIDKELVKMPASDSIEVQYEHFLAAPYEVINRALNFSGLHSIDSSVIDIQIRQNRETAWKQEIPEDELSNMEQIMEEVLISKQYKI